MTRDMCFQGGEQISLGILISYPDLTLFYTFPWPWEIRVRDYRDMCLPGGGTHITRDMFFPGKGIHITTKYLLLAEFSVRTVNYGPSFALGP